MVREREAQSITERLKSYGDGEAVGAAMLPELLSDLNVTLASPDVVAEAMEAVGLQRKPQLLMEDIMCCRHVLKASETSKRVAEGC